MNTIVRRREKSSIHEIAPGVRGRRALGALGVQSLASLTSRAGELRSAPSGPDDRYRVAGKRALAPGVRVRRARAVK